MDNLIENFRYEWPDKFKHKIPNNMDASEWAAALVERYPHVLSQIPGNEGVLQSEEWEGVMIEWFANAIMMGYDEGRRIGYREGLDDHKR